MIFLLLITLAFLLLRIQDELDERPLSSAVTASCPACDKEISLEWMVCPHCLQRLRENCSSCQQRKLISHSFCHACGSTSGERTV